MGLRSLIDGTLATKDDIISQQIDQLGLSSFPSEWWNSWKGRHEYFSEDGQPNGNRSVLPSLEESFEQEIQDVRREESMNPFDKEEAEAILSMLRTMLVFRPEERATIESVMKSEWMVIWGLPAYEKLKRRDRYKKKKFG